MMIIAFKIFLFSSVVAIANGRCSDGKVDGELVATRYKGEFFYTGDSLNRDAWQVGPNEEHHIRFQDDGVSKWTCEPNEPCTSASRAYSYRNKDGIVQGNSSSSITTEYPADGEAEEFKTLCEELWACSQMYSQYASKQPEGRDYEKRSMCFDDPYKVVDEEIRLRENFIVDSCWGGRKSLSKKKTISYLEGARDQSCAGADELVDRLLFDHTKTADPEACKATIDCMKEGKNKIFQSLIDEGLLDQEQLNNALQESSTDDLYEYDGDLAYEVCAGRNAAEIQTLRDECLSELESGSSCDPPSFPQRSGPPLCGTFDATIPYSTAAQPLCPTRIADKFASFEPEYPVFVRDGVGDYGYTIATATIRTTFITCDNDRTSADAYGIILFLRPFIKAVEVFVDQLADSLPDDLPYIIAKILPLVPKIILQSFDIVLDQADYHDGMIHAAEIEALYENTRQLLNASAAIYDEVACRCIPDLVTRPQRGHGCDSIDNDCDDIVDDCAEDNWKPEIFSSAAVAKCSGRWFQTEAEARACVESVTSALDDCDDTLALSTSDFALSGSCASSIFSVSTKDRCDNEADPKIVPVWIDDEEPPKVSCYFSGDASKRQLILFNSTGASVLENVKLSYTAQDGCREDVEVTVEVYSNEIEDFHNQKIGVFFQDGLPNKAANLYIAKGICSTASNGQCIKDPVFPNNRIYTVVVTGTDISGRSALTECSIVIVPKNSQVTTFDVTPSKQRFFLDSHTSTFFDSPTGSI